MRCLIYCRKSTDRDDKQANSLEHQLQNCRNTLASLWFTLVREIVESVSAKEEYKRAGFNEMVELCKQKKADFIIIDEPKRLSRNNIDTSRIIDLMDKNLIRGIYATSRQYLSTNSRDKFLLQLDLSLSKMDNEDRANDIKSKMLTCAKRGQCLWKAPFGYKNITVRKGHKAVIVEPTEAEIVKRIFQLRQEKLTYEDIAKRINTTYDTPRKFIKSAIFNMLYNRFYIGKVQFDGKEYDGQHEPIISKELFDSVQENIKGVYTWTPNREDLYPLKGYLRDIDGIRLNGYRTKGHTYYKSQSRSGLNVNISESRLLSDVEATVREYDDRWIQISDFFEAVIRDIMKQRLYEKERMIDEVQNAIFLLEQKASSLLDMKLDGKVSDELFETKNKEIQQEIQKYKSKKEKIETVKIEKIQAIQEKMVELTGSLYRSYKSGDTSYKSLILKNMMVELFVSNKKELTLAENKLFGFLKSVNFQDGATDRTWTCDLLLRREAF